MTTSSEPARTKADPDEVARLIRELTELEAADPAAFRERLADNIMEPIPEETAAFRSDDLAFKSFVAAKYLTENANSVLQRRRRGSQQRRNTEGFMQKVAYERRILEALVNGLRAQRGLLPNAPNPRQRAMRRLVNENLAGDVPKNRFRELFEEEKQRDRDRKKEARRNRSRR